MLFLIRNILLVLFVFLLSIVHAKNYTDDDCLSANFKVEVSHKSNLFGFIERKISIEKKECNLVITHNSWKYIENKWIIDICRGPVHVKYGTGIVEAYKKNLQCVAGGEDKYCKLSRELMNLIQDDGLIFASGIKEDLESDHGKMYCSYIALEKYLEDSVVFNVGQKYDGVLREKEVVPVTTPIPIVVKVEKNIVPVVNDIAPAIKTTEKQKMYNKFGEQLHDSVEDTSKHGEF